ncbi:MAG: CTP synthase [Candidatus Liptonbacteria bacterium RIFOXYC1_FULL_36_8]|uniref:CTP synthase n=3 Tax=Candidatus Liptoniibacteriota TaxID=1817909 RepID=A0A1G2CL42_9BACT|nr:MAG: CTP synthase [Candidatus Liptonbacteria bacterium RIFOXYB1_FULL_36_10]OGZ03915.1 MAG: CTP synthase [Candidatus Liptonbacteria bacterium RIFOXYD1_FULL_36_11]OGZ04333.1 MAG: CTP synthase [Candidatus Liptonbacteria bacterium RIFOXYC1_FULL_36_8]
MSTKYIFVTGGVMSGVGKGVATASIGRILKNYGFNVTAVKIDPYVNVDAGTMNPIEHGEVFVTDDGMECDQDVGNYERFLDTNISRDNYMTTGSVYLTVIQKERNLEYEGKCVEVVPHIPEEVIRRIERVARKTKADFVLIEIGGTVGEYQNMLFLEAGRMMKLAKPDGVIFVLVSYLPIPRMVGEMKTKPTQYAVRTLNSAGIQPDIILARASQPLDEPRKKKISMFCNILPESVISAPDVKSIYQIPINFEKDGMSRIILKKFGMRPRHKNGMKWNKAFTNTDFEKEVKIGIVGKYFSTGAFTLSDSYISVIEAIKHAAYSLGHRPIIDWINSEKFEKGSVKENSELKNYDGIIVPGGFGTRGVEGKIKVIEYARKNKIPFLGLCYGMQMAAIEFVRNVCGKRDAHTTEINQNTKNPVIHILPEQLENMEKKNYGGSMRLGAYNCELKRGTKAYAAYKQPLISERHRHRYEFNNDYKEMMEKKGMIFSGINPEKNLVEILELKSHPFFMATQFHPEFKSKPLNPHPLFLEFIKSAIKK